MSNDDTATGGQEDHDPAAQRRAVRERYGAIATDSGTDDLAPNDCCGDDGCGDSATGADADHSQQLGYSDEEVAAVAEGANLGLGCGNPTALAALNRGETVLDLGSGGGFDCFLAADEVGPEGHVIGVDMTPAMVERARENVAKNDATNVEFRLGEIEHLPVADGTVDAIISNCVVNLSPDKAAVLADAFRVLRPGGRVAISDVVLTAEPPADIRNDLDLVAGCVGGAATIAEFETLLADAGFVDVTIDPKDDSERFIREWDDERDLSEYLTSADIRARKPA